MDRAWYDQDEEAPFLANFDEGYNPHEKATLETKKKRENQPVSRHKKNLADHEKWEINRMVQSGAMTESDNYRADLFEEEEDRVVLVTHDVKPPFLDGRITFTTQAKAVEVVRDPTSDFAKLSKKGSSILKHIRERNDKTKMRERFWELAGSKLGSLMKIDQKKIKEEEQKKSGMKEEVEEDKTVYHENGEVNYKESNQYAKAMGNSKDNAVTAFSKNKTLQQQREFLPVYDVRNELMTCIRDNKILIVVGETGSGKTTQLTQYLYEEGYTKNGMIGCTQPRRVAAVSVAKRVAEEMKGEIGDK